MIRLTDEQWERIRNHFPEENIPDGRAGRKPVSTRRVLEAVLWILNTGAQWHMLPQSYPNYKTVHRRFQTWCRDDVLRRVLTDVANELLYGPAARCKAKMMIWRKLVLRFCIRPIDGAFELLAIMDIRARSISFATRPRRPYGPPDHERAGETFLHLLFPTRRPQRESQLLLSAST
jgi:transposase